MVTKMPNFTGMFRRRPAVGAIPRSNATRLNGAAITLNANLRTYVNGYVNARNNNSKKNSIPPMNAKIVNSLKRYINSKRPRAAGAVAAAVNAAGGNNNQAAQAANAMLITPPSAAPSTAATKVANATLNAGGSNNAAAAAGAAAAQQQLAIQGRPASQANAAGANAAAQTALALRPNAGPGVVANAAAVAAANAGLPVAAQQQAAQQAAANVNNRNVNAIRARLNGPNMSPGNWYRYAASLGYNTGKYANEANRLTAAGNKKALSTFILKSMMTVHPNKGNRSNAKNQQIRNLLTRNLTKARNNLAKN